MRFELSIALKYLIPKRRQLSASIITLVSICVVSLVVWLAIVFLSISEGLQKRWVESFTAFHSPLKIVPTQAYYDSYFYQIDGQAMSSGYLPKSLEEKRLSGTHDPYDPTTDRSLPLNFPAALRDSQGNLVNLIDEAWQAASNLNSAQKLSLSTHATSICNLQLKVGANEPGAGDAFLSQVCYISPLEEKKSVLHQKILNPDIKEVMALLQRSEDPLSFFKEHRILKATLDSDTLALAKEDYPSTGKCVGCAFYPTGSDKEVCLIPPSKNELDSLIDRIAQMGYEPRRVSIQFARVQSYEPFSALYITKGTPLHDAIFHEQSEVPFTLRARSQGLFFNVHSTLEDLQLESIQWPDEKMYYSQSISSLFTQNLEATSSHEAHGILVASVFKKKGVHLGDRGTLSFLAPTATSIQEQKISVYVAGFFDTTTFPFASRYLFVHPEVFESTSIQLAHIDDMFADGIQVSFDNVAQTARVKKELIAALETRGISEYWKVISFDELEIVRPILTQFQTEKILFTLIMTIILAVASTNIISMLILLVNDKMKEIGILQALGASRLSISSIFALCGLITGLISSLLGTTLAIVTIRNIDFLTSTLSKIQGREFFQIDFYGGELPAYISVRVLLLILCSTVILSILAAVVPALKASSVRPSQILRREQS